MTSLDLRLAVPAAGAWLAAAICCGLAPAIAAAVIVTAAMLMTAAATAHRLTLAAACVGVLLGAAAAAVHVEQLRSGPVAALARSAHPRADLLLTLVRDPISRRNAHGRPYVLADATVTEVARRPAHSAVIVIAHGAGWIGLLPGQRVRVTARLLPPRAGDDVAAVVLPRGQPVLVGRPPWWQRAAGAVRDRLRTACARLPPDERGLVPGLVVGDVSGMPASLTDAFRVSGLTHLNAVSGENCAIVLATVGAVLRRTPLRRGWRIAVAAASLAAFVVLARPSASVLRAAVMGGAALLAMSVGRRTQPVPLLSAAVLLLVLIDPFLARSVGFALSVVATAAIVLLVPRWADALATRMPRWLGLAIAVPAAAQLACTPLLVLVFGQATPWAVPANLLAAPAVAPATVMGVLTAAVSTLSTPVASVLVWAAALPAAWLALVARSMAALPGASATWPAGVRGLGLLAGIAAVGLCLLFVRRRLSSRHAMLAPWLR